jgi:acyl-coenzyme A synthetase/AMP-(fatty) acid ligase
MDNIADVKVYGEKNPIIGNMVCAKVVLFVDENRKEFVTELKQFCAMRMKKFMVPVKVEFSDEKLYGERYKKVRS